MLNFKKLFIKKVKEAEECVNSAEEKLSEAENKIKNLKSMRKVDFYREEIITLIDCCLSMEYRRGFNNMHHFKCEHPSEFRDKRLHINALLIEMSNLLGLDS